MDIDPNSKIIREPENYEEMVRKLREREEELEEPVKKKLKSNPEKLSESTEALEMARKEMQQRSTRRDYKSLSVDEKETKVNPADPQVIELKNRVHELSQNINTKLAESPDPKVRNAILKGRITVGDVNGGDAAPAA